MRGFSLVELSIVLVILGLLTGGILTGQTLVRAAELRAVTTEFQNFQTASSTFRDKYFALPGDMRNAHDFWGSAGGSGVIGDGCEAAIGTGTETCSGNGDGNINQASAGSEVGENFSFWQHLANAGLIEGNYTGISGSVSGTDIDTRVNVPATKFGNGAWSMHAIGDFGGNIVAFALDYGNNFTIGVENPAGGGAGQPLFTPEEAWNIDTKMDDGRPGYGSIIAFRWDDQCSSADVGASALTNLDASYRLSDQTTQCALAFVKPM